MAKGLRTPLSPSGRVSRKKMPNHFPNLNGKAAGRVREVTYWRVEGSLFEISALRSVGFFNWNSQSFLERWVRRGGMLGLALLRPPYYLISRTFATQIGR